VRTSSDLTGMYRSFPAYLWVESSGDKEGRGVHSVLTTHFARLPILAGSAFGVRKDMPIPFLGVAPMRGSQSQVGWSASPLRLRFSMR